MKLFILSAALLFLGCTPKVPTPNTPPPAPPSVQPQPTPAPPSVQPQPTPAPPSVQPQPTPAPSSGHVPLSWENTTEAHPERAPWSDALLAQITNRFSTLDKAQDMAKFCPTYVSLPQPTRVLVWGELMVADSYYESSYDPTEADVDVGSQSDKNTWSIGLWQLSVVDQDWVGEDFNKGNGVYKYTYDQLLVAQNNADLAMAIMSRQIVNKGIIAIPAGSSGLYWATLHPGGEYDETSSIASRVQKNVSACVSMNAKKLKKYDAKSARKAVQKK